MKIEVVADVSVSGRSCHFSDPGQPDKAHMSHTFDPSTFVVSEYYMRNDSAGSPGAFLILRGDASGWGDYSVNFRQGSNSIGIFGSTGWIEPDLLSYDSERWYYVRRVLDCTTNSGHFYVEQVGNPGNSAYYEVGSDYTISYVNEVLIWTGGEHAADCYIDEISIVPAPGALILASIGLGFSGWLCKRRTA